jgi:alpha-mannosidase
MRVRLRELRSDDAIVTLGGAEVPHGARVARYRTRTGALLRIGGTVCGAFDREHHAFVLPRGIAGAIELEVERRSLPQTGLPARNGIKWQWLLATAAEPARTAIEFAGETSRAPSLASAIEPLPAVGHSHLDVAWLWTYDEAIRKSARTFATAVRQLGAHPAFVFAQTTPQLYADVARAEPELFERMRALARAARLDTSGAACWVEADCNLPSGESLLRQLVFGMRYVEREFGAWPSVAWLPDSFGFANTLPTLLQHAGIAAFGTTKLTWNDTNAFPHARFAWEGPDGSRVTAVNVASIQGGFERERVRRARARGDLLLVGYGDGGGGVRDDTLDRAPDGVAFTTLGAWFEAVAKGPLRVVRDELYLEEHRGVLTTHRDIKVRNAALERALGDAELALAWAVVLRATPFFVREARGQLERAWALVLRAQFHDVLPGSAIAEAYVRVRDDLDEAAALAAHVRASARGALPAAAPRVAQPADVSPQSDRRGHTLRNDRIFARIAHDGTLTELRLDGGRNLVRSALRLALYVDRPRRWDAWNVDRSYRTRRCRVRVTSVAPDDDGIAIAYAFGTSLAVVRVSLGERATSLSVEIAVAWNERHRLLRLENVLAFAATSAFFGSPHGTIARTPRPRSRVERARFEACGQRFARVEDARGGFALLARDTYGWSVDTNRTTALGNSLLRAPMWPDPDCDRGKHVFAFELVPFVALGMGELEARWTHFVDGGGGGVPMFTCDDRAIAIVATKPADDGEGIVVRARECDGAVRNVAIRSAVRMREVHGVDALERPLANGGALPIEGEVFRASFRPYEVRTFRVRNG